jgi:pyruvate kinase
MPSPIVPRSRKVRVLATLGPASNDLDMIRRLVKSGADAFRINMSHGTHEDHAARIQIIRSLEKELERPTTILADLQGPKLRVGKFAGDKAELENGQSFVLDRTRRPEMPGE